MKKVISVHLSNKMYQIEEDAYTYLNNALSNQWRKEELEAQIAEKLDQKLTGGKMVITYPDVVDVLYQLGFPSSDSRTTTKIEFPYTGKKIYRQLKNKLIGGVCSGLGEYLEIDPVILRVLFVIAFLMASMGFWLYLILWIIIPKAPSTQ